MKQFDCLSSINPADPHSWGGKIFLSFDIDWAHDDVLLDTIDLVEQAGVCATWFVTHDTPVLSRLRKNPKFELGIHPNFNELIAGNDRAGKNAQEIISSLKTLVPEARVVRSHSLLQSERLIDLFHAQGLTHISNFFIPETVGQELWPWRLWDGITAIPHGWQDNVSMRLHGTIQSPSADTSLGLRVVDFHPIHVFLNTERVDRYEAARPYFQSPAALLACRNKQEGAGARDILNHLLKSS